MTPDTPKRPRRVPKDGRWKPNLRKSADPLRSTKLTLEKMFNRPLGDDEFFYLLVTQYTDLPAEKSVSTEARRILQELEVMLRKNRAGEAADCVEMFADALANVIEGHMTNRALFNALINAED